MKWAKLSKFLHGKAKRAADKEKNAVWHTAWQDYLQDFRNGKRKIAEGWHEGVGQQDVFILAKEMKWEDSLTTSM